MFGGPASTPFGASPGGFGQSNSAPAFGSPAPAPFGAPAPSGGFGGFGAPVAAPSTFGGFGTPAPAPSTGFGGFGAPAPAPSGFGSSVGGFGAAPAPSLFGAPAPAPGGLFGSNPAPAPGGLFGSAPAPTPGGFGTTTSAFGGGGGFGAAPAPAFGGGSAFGAPAPAPTGLFGASPAPTPGGFGSSGFGASTTGAFGSPAHAPPSTGLFGAPASAPSTGLFGAPSLATGGAAGGGTKIQPYQVTNRQDGTSSISLQAITAMPAYENKSFEELRFEDYSQGNRGTGGAAPAPSGGFGSTGGFGAPAPAPMGGLFGAPAPAFGAPAPAPGGFGFGAPAPALFGAPAPAPFGAPAPALFGSPAPAPFGAPAPAPGAFGSSAFGVAKPPASGGLFGAPAPSNVGLFGSTPAQSPGGGLFGSNPAPAPGVFGAPAPTGGGLFGAPAPAPFGAPAPAFGAPAPAPFGGGFGAPAPGPQGGSLFGAPAPGAFGAPAPGGSLFGAPSSGSSLFGAPKPPSGGLFGAPAPAPPAQYGFGAPAPGAFGPPAPYAMPAPPPIGAIIPPANDEMLAAQVAALEKCRKELDNNDTFRKRSSDSATVTGASLSERDILALMPPRTPYSMFRASPKSSAKVRPRGFASPEKAPFASLSRLGSGGKPMPTPDRLAALSATRVVINPSPKPKLKLALQPSSSASPLQLSSDPAHSRGLTPAPKPLTPTTTNGGDGPFGSTNDGYTYYKHVVASPGDDARGTPSAQRENVAPSLTKAEYSCSPSIDVLATFSDADLAAVSNFSVERVGVGRIEWEGAVDIRGTDLDEVVIIEPKSASVYMKEEEEGTKPAVGTKLNRSAVITLEGVYAPEPTLESQDKFSRKVERQTKKMGAELISYDPTSGIWKLRVQHFSRYALDEDDDASSDVDFEPVERDEHSHALGEGVRHQATPFKIRKNVAVLVEDDDMEDVDEAAITKESKLLAEAETAFNAIQTRAKEHNLLDRRVREESTPFPDEGEPSPPTTATPSRYIPTTTDLATAARKGSVCQATSQGVLKDRLSTDFGMRMGRSFRVGWNRDGSFFTPTKVGTFVRCAPRFSHDDSAKEDSLRYLKQHRSGAVTVGRNDCPQLCLPSDNNLNSLLSSFAEVAPHTTKGSFALLKALTSGVSDDLLGTLAVPDVEDLGRDDLEQRRLFAVRQWLIETCRDDVDDEIRTTISSRSKTAAVLAAVSGGNLERACEVASELGYHSFAQMLCVGPDARADILAEALSSQLPEELLRSFLVLGGDMRKEEELCKRGKSSFDWRRRLVMALTYSKQGGTSLASLVADYNDKVRHGLAPFPKPARGGHEDERVENACFRILCLGGSAGDRSLLGIADPRGHSSSIHDYSTSFHISAAVAATKLALPMSRADEQVLVEGYAAQLLSHGQWEWAVYVLLCSLGTKANHDVVWSQSLAKDLVLRNFQSHMTTQRNFLEGVGVPTAWFEEAVALQCGCNGDLVGYLSHMVKVDPHEACLSLESTLIPTMLFLNKEALAEARTVLDAFSGNDDDSLTAAVNDMFKIYEEIQLLERLSRADIDEMSPSLVERCERVEKTLVSCHAGEMKLQGPSLRLIPGTKAVPVAFFLAESLSQISLFKMRLRAIMSGACLSNTPSQFLDLALPEDMLPGGISERENFLRWLL